MAGRYVLCAGGGWLAVCLSGRATLAAGLQPPLLHLPPHRTAPRVQALSPTHHQPSAAAACRRDTPCPPLPLCHSMQKAVDHVVDIVAPLAKRDVAIDRYVDPKTPLIIADFSRVIQVGDRVCEMGGGGAGEGDLRLGWVTPGGCSGRGAAG